MPYDTGAGAGSGGVTAIVQGAGGALQAYAAYRAQQQMFQAYQEELRRQGGFAAQATNQFNAGLANQSVEHANALRQAGEAARLASYGGATLGKSKLNAGDALSLAQESGARATLGGYGDWAAKQPLEQLATQQALARIYDQAQGQQNIYPYGLYQAQHSYDDLAGFGKALSGLGDLSSTVGQFQDRPNYSTNQYNQPHPIDQNSFNFTPVGGSPYGPGGYQGYYNSMPPGYQVNKIPVYAPAE